MYGPPKRQIESVDRRELPPIQMAKEQQFLLFAEKAALRFSIKEVSGILDNLNSMLCKQAVVNEMMNSGPCIDGAKQIKHSLNSMQDSSFFSKSLEMTEQSNTEKSNLQLLDKIRLEANILQTRF